MFPFVNPTGTMSLQSNFGFDFQTSKGCATPGSFFIDTFSAWNILKSWALCKFTFKHEVAGLFFWFLWEFFTLPLTQSHDKGKFNFSGVRFTSFSTIVTEQTHWGVNNILLPKGPPFFLGVPAPTYQVLFTRPEERCLSIPEIGEKGRNYLFKNYTDLE